MEYNTAIEMNELRIHTTTQLNLKSYLWFPVKELMTGEKHKIFFMMKTFIFSLVIISWIYTF